MLGLIDSLGQLFRSLGASRSDAGRATGRFAKLESEFETVLDALDRRIERQRSVARRADPQALGAQDRAAEKLRRKAAAHRAMRADIEAMHVRLRTGFTRADLDDVVAFLQSLADFARPGRSSRALLPRVRYTVTERLRAESGPMAMDRVLARLRRRSLGWPDPAQYPPGATREEIETSRRRRLADVRAAFVCYDLERIAERAQGIVWGWGADYPDRESLLWRESVLVGVAAAIWGRLLQHLVELLRQDADLLLLRIEELVDEKLPALHAVLDEDSASAAQARDALASSMHVLDQVVPDLGWQLVSARLPCVRAASAPEAPGQGASWPIARAGERRPDVPMGAPCS